MVKTRPTASSNTTSSNRILRGIPSLGNRKTKQLLSNFSKISLATPGSDELPINVARMLDLDAGM